MLSNPNRQNIVFLRGGLGNQFFQWVFALYLKSGGIDVVLDDSFLVKRAGNQARGALELKNVFDDLVLPVRTSFKKISSLEPLIVRSLKFLHFLDDESKQFKLGRILPWFHYGYYQRPSYFNKFVNAVVQANINANINDVDITAILDICENFAAIHIRSGDYNNSGYNFNKIGVLSPVYYKKCIEKIPSGVSLVIVSDDENWARSLLDQSNLRSKFIFLSSLTDQYRDPYVALKVMIKAKYLVCANSSFSGMSGYLNPMNNVFYPSPWFKDCNALPNSLAQSDWVPVESSFIC